MKDQGTQSAIDLRQEARRRHANRADFCVIFREDMSSLYSLALVLTADADLAEQCFIAALDDCINASDVFPEWARSWSRRAVVKQAIRIVDPKPEGVGSASNPWQRGIEQGSDHVLASVMQLPAFERFVFAMTVLERYSTQECVALLKCAARDIPPARIRALQLVAAADRRFGRAPDADAGSARPEPVFNLGVGA